MTFEMGITMVAFVFVAVCLLTNRVAPSVACGVAVAVLWICGVITEQEALANFVGSSIVCMIGMMIVTSGLMRTNILINIAGLVQKMNGGIYIMLLASMVVPFILGQFIGGVTAMITVIPLAMALAEASGISPTIVVLPASVGAQAGLMALPIGSGAVMYLMKNQIMAGLGCNEELNFWDLCIARLPGTLLVFLFVLLVGWKLLPDRGLADESLLESGGMKGLKKSSFSTGRQYLMYVIFIATMIMLSVGRKHGISQTLVSVVAALLVVLLGYLNEQEMYQSVNWSLIFMMAFMLAISTALGNSGAGEMMANLLKPVYGSGNLMAAVTVTFVVCVIATQFMDNLSLINILTPICVAACMQNGISPLPIVCAIDASCLVSFSTPMASPSSLMAYRLGGYSMKEMLKFNIPLIAIATIISVIWIPFYFTILR